MENEYNFGKQKKRFQYDRIIISVISLLAFFLSLNVITKDTVYDDITIVGYSKFIFGYLAIVLSIVAFAFSIYLLVKSPNNKNINILKKIITIVLIIFLGIYLIEYLVFSILNSAIRVSTLTKLPDRSAFLDSVLYILSDYAGDFLKGTLKTLELALFGTGIGLIFAFFLVMLRTLKIDKRDNEVVSFIKRVLKGFSKLYVNVFRGTPMIVQAMIFYYLVPSLISRWFGIDQKTINEVFTVSFAAIVVVSLNTTAYLTEVLRGGIESVDKGQMEASRSLGMSYYSSMFKIVLPQAIRNSLPAIGNEFIINIKDTSVLNVIGVAELFFVGRAAQSNYYRIYETFIIIAVIYLFLTMTTSKILSYIEKRMNLESRPLPSSN